MATPNRASLLNKTYRTLKKRYKAATPRGEQPVLEALLFAACLENTSPVVAEEVYGAVKASFFDWNEIRVSTVKELAEVMEPLFEPMEAAARLKGILQTVFESDYSFDLENLKKQNLGQAIKRLQKLEGSSPFIVAYATQTALGGHSIPIDRGALEALYALGIISEAEAASRNVPGLERTIPKNKGHEFGSLLHQLGAEYLENMFAQPVRDLIMSISPDAKDRFPKRGVKKPTPTQAASVKAPPEKPAEKPIAVVKHKTAEKAAEKPRRPVEHTAKRSPAKDKKKPVAKHKKPTRSKPLARKKPR